MLTWAEEKIAANRKFILKKHKKNLIKIKLYVLLLLKNTPMFDYKYEVIIKAPNAEIASYTYCWMDKITRQEILKLFQ